MSENLIIGLLGMFVPLFAVGYLMLNKMAGVFRMYVAMLLVGLGYLSVTGAVEDIGGRILGRTAGLAIPVDAAAPAPAAEKAAEAPKADAAPAGEAKPPQ